MSISLRVSSDTHNFSPEFREHFVAHEQRKQTQKRKPTTEKQKQMMAFRAYPHGRHYVRFLIVFRVYSRLSLWAIVDGFSCIFSRASLCVILDGFPSILSRASLCAIVDGFPCRHVQLLLSSRVYAHGRSRALTGSRTLRGHFVAHELGHAQFKP